MLNYIIILLGSIIVVELLFIIWKLYYNIVPVMDSDLVKKNTRLSDEVTHLKAGKDNQKKQYKANVKKYKQSISDLKKENKRLREENCPEYEHEITCLNKILCEKENEINLLKEQLKE